MRMQQRPLAAAPTTHPHQPSKQALPPAAPITPRRAPARPRRNANPTRRSGLHRPASCVVPSPERGQWPAAFHPSGEALPLRPGRGPARPLCPAPPPPAPNFDAAAPRPGPPAEPLGTSLYPPWGRPAAAPPILTHTPSPPPPLCPPLLAAPVASGAGRAAGTGVKRRGLSGARILCTVLNPPVARAHCPQNRRRPRDDRPRTAHPHDARGARARLRRRAAAPARCRDTTGRRPAPAGRAARLPSSVSPFPCPACRATLDRPKRAHGSQR